MSIYEHAEEPMPPKPEYDPAMDHPEPEPEPSKRKRKPMPFVMERQDYGARRYLMTGRIIITFSRRYCKYAIIMQRMTSEPYLTVDRKDVAKLLRHYRKEASC
jgi:hypothetical protein